MNTGLVGAGANPEEELVIQDREPPISDSDLDDGLNMAEDIQDWLSLKSNRQLTTADGTFCLVPPFEMENLFDPDQVDEAGVMFTISNFNYRFFKNRT